MAFDEKDYGFIRNEDEWNSFLKREKIMDYSKVPVPRARIRGWVRIALLLLEAYISAMVVIVILGFLHII